MFFQKDQSKGYAALLCLFITLCFFNQISAQSIEAQFIPQWIGVQQISLPTIKPKQVYAPAFENCVYDTYVPILPCYTTLIPIGSKEELAVRGIYGDKSDTIDDRFANWTAAIAARTQDREWYPPSPVVLGQRVCRQKQWYQQVTFYPMQIHRDGYQVRKYQVLNYQLSRQPVANAPSNERLQRTYAANSVLSTGDWYRMAITQDGIYRIDKRALEQLGINTAAIDPRNIRLFGNGGAMLPQRSGDPRTDDLGEIAVFVEGEADGRFDESDYILFFGQGPHIWKTDINGNVFHEKNVYSDTAYYHLTIGNEAGLRVSTVSGGSGTGLPQASVMRYVIHDEDKNNLLRSGRMWFGPTFDLQTTYPYTLPVPGLQAGSTIQVSIRTANRSDFRNTFTIRESGREVAVLQLGTVNTGSYEGTYANLQTHNFTIPADQVTDGRLDFEITYNKTGGAQAWIDWIQVSYPQNLQLIENQMPLRLPAASVPRAISLGNAANARIWDVSNRMRPLIQGFRTENDRAIFDVVRTQPTYLIAFRPELAPGPLMIGKIANQNLHGLPQADYIIVTHPDFRSAADKLADFHRQEYGRRVHVVTPQEIYNEFSSGQQDVSAIRDFVKMFYDRAGNNKAEMPKYLLLFGDATYDPKGIRVARSHVPTYQSRQSIEPPISYNSDDYFGFLDDDEGFWGEATRQFENDSAVQTHLVDIGIGRLPATSVKEANNIVNKIIDYARNPVSLGNWRTRILLIGDQKAEDGTTHMAQADGLGATIERLGNCYNQDKIYLDNYPAVNLAEGIRYPAAKEDLIARLNSGSFVVNYTGHGNEFGWSNSYLFESKDIVALRNENKLPFYVTATCEFGRYDDPAYKSGAEQLLLNEKTGAIGLLTSVRLVYSQYNYEFNQNFYRNFFLLDSTENNRHLTLGEIYQRTKNTSWGGGMAINTRNFALLGDPGLTLAFPKYKIVVTEINGNPVNGDTLLDTLRALSLVRIKGEVRDVNNNRVTDFNGELQPTVFDKPVRSVTKTVNFPFFQQKTVLFNGRVSVINGEFEFKFVVPLDINYRPGNGKISLYAFDNRKEGIGCSNEIIICCTDSTAGLNTTPPTVRLVMNAEPWADGGLTDANPLLIAYVADDQGINTTGVGVGRELTGILNGQTSNPYILNDYYQTERDSYNKGVIRYRLNNLPVGEHTIRVKVWDVSNNSGTGETRFLVSDNAKLAIENILNYPNPFTTRTRFLFSHNKPGEVFDLNLNIFTVTGKLVKSFRGTYTLDGNIFDQIEWDGLDEYGDRIGRGVYLYKLEIKMVRTGEQISKYEKLVLLR